MMDTTRATLELLSTFDDAELRATAEAHGIPGTGRLRRRRLLETLSATLDAERLLSGLADDALERACDRFDLSSGATRSEQTSAIRAHLTRPPVRRPFVALDFETADSGRDSACAIALVRVEAGQIVARTVRLIRPPRRTFEFTYIHGISWRDVAREGTFAEVWPALAPMLEGAAFLAAHNAGFDQSVLRACTAQAGLSAPATPFLCTVKVARSAWNLRPTRLPDVARHLRLPLTHHDAASDAEVCARIVLAAGADLHFAGPATPNGDREARG
jgi:DNA polymerase-3 subunit epsilon